MTPKEEKELLEMIEEADRVCEHDVDRLNIKIQLAILAELKWIYG